MIRSALFAAVLLGLPAAAAAQALDMSQGGPVTVTSRDGIDWDQKAQTVTAVGQARAVRGNVTVDADRLIAFYRKKQPPPGTAASATAIPGATSGATSGATPGPTPAAATTAIPASNAVATSAGGAPGDDTGNNEIYRLEAIGHVHIYTATDQAWGDQALYDIDKATLVLTGHALRLLTPTDDITARDSMEYYSQTRMSVARGDAVLVTNDARRVQADVLVGFSAPSNASPPPGGKPAAPPPKPAAAPGAPAPDPLTQSGKLQRAEAYGDVVLRTPTETVRGDRGVYVAATDIARVLGNVHITRGQNQLDGQAAIVNMRTGIATMTNDPGERVHGLIVPNDNSANGGAGGNAAKPARADAPARSS